MTVLCVNLNAAVDKTLVIEHFRLSAIHRPQEVIVQPGGKGCNVARSLKTLGEPGLVTGWVGGHAGRFIEAGLHSEGIETAFIYTPTESRECISVLDPAEGTLTEVYEKGAPIARGDVEAFFKLYLGLLDRAGVVTLSGSLPPGVPADFYALLIPPARERNIPVLLDTGGEALRQGLKAGPDLIKPNQDEFEALTGGSGLEMEELACTAARFASESGISIAITLGSRGALAVNDQGAWLAQPPAVNAKSAVGSGDAFLAGWAASIVRKQSFEDALRFCAAVGTANTLVLGAGRFHQKDIDHILPQVDLRPVG